jgi:hypothetical protein
VATDRSDAEVLRAGLDWLGEEGEHWIKDKLVQFKYGVTRGRVCAEGAVRIGLWGSTEMPAEVEQRRRLKRILGLLVQVAVEQFPEIRAYDGEVIDIIPEFNDHPGVGFGDVRVVFDKAIAMAEAEARNE